MSRPGELIGFHPLQQAVVDHRCLGGPGVVIAGAGTGKTTVVVQRLLAELSQGRPAESVTVVTFTRKAAAELRTRLQSVLAQGMVAPWAGTFHALARRILQESLAGYTGWERLGRGCGGETAPRLLGDGEVEKAWCGFWPEWFRRGGGLPPDPQLFERTRASHASPDALEAAEPSSQLPALWRAWNLHKEQLGVVEFDDLIENACRLLESDDATRQEWSRRCGLLVVDEFQDTSPGQERLVARLLDGEPGLLAVGDDDQSIYGFRGADLGVLLRLLDAPGTTAMPLLANFRSQPGVLEVANRIFPDKPPHLRKILLAGRSADRVPADLLEARDDEAEARGVRRWLEQRLIEGVEPSQICLLVRYHHQMPRARRILSSLPDGPVITTIHAAKGLEWPCVVLPFQDAPAETAPRLAPFRDDEERRVAYVAVTRARDRLLVTWSRRHGPPFDAKSRAPLPWLGLAVSAFASM